MFFFTLSGLMMMPAKVLAYFQLGQFLMLVMVFSWLYSTFIFLSICTMIGPKNDFGQLNVTRLFRRCGLCRVKPEESTEPIEKNELVTVKQQEASDLQATGTTSTLWTASVGDPGEGSQGTQPRKNDFFRPHPLTLILGSAWAGGLI